MRKEYYDRHTITISEELARQYGKMNKSEILLHQYVLSIVDNDGVVKRNMEAAARVVGCCKKSLYNAETSLVVRGLLRRTSRSGRIFWKLVPTTHSKAEAVITDDVIGEVADLPSTGQAEATETLERQDRVITMEKPKRRGFLSWLRRKKDEG